ncbi:MAG: 3-phenylpropionate/trans-cinnamate dioxygenase ferredoxin reductase component, partial [Thermoleophilaceae bacterium]|nr:3-phenylpropionate/trans-cinnamate dioxygenase ferredoxin reductase component [Thermoleophilaceae bacterium]
MPERNADYLLIGGFAAAHCARTLREEGADGSILLVAREVDSPYERPPLSKEYLSGESTREDALVVPEKWWEEHDVELLKRTSVMKLDSGERVAKLSTKEEVGFGKALLATGANVRRLRNDGSDLEGIHYLRAFGNADSIAEDSEEAENVVLIGGSYIGSEVAASLTKLGKKCTIVMQEDCSFGHVFGETVGCFFHELLESKGVTLQNSDEL